MKYQGKRINRDEFYKAVAKQLKPIETYKKIYEEHLLKLELERLKIKNKANNLEDAIAIVEKIKGGMVIRYVWMKANKGYSVCREVERKILSFDEKDFIVAYNNRYYVTARGFYFGERSTEWKIHRRFSYYDYSNIGFSELKINHSIEPLKYCARYFEWRFKLYDSYNLERIILQIVNEPRYEIAYKNEYFDKIFDIEQYSNKQLCFATKNKLVEALPFIKDFNCYDAKMLQSIKDINQMQNIFKVLNANEIDKNRFLKFIRNYINKNQEFPCVEYKDFLKNLEDLNLEFKKWVFDKDFLIDHYHFVDEITKIKNKQLIKIWGKKYKETAKQYKNLVYKNEEYLVRVPKDIPEFISEANEQHNCLFANGYYKKMARGECIILLVRMINEPNQPYATIELDPKGKMVQARLKYNKQASKEVINFVNEAYLNYQNQLIKQGALA